LAAAAAATALEHDHNGKGHVFQGDPCPPGEPAGGPKFADGPHSTETANRLDPHNHGGHHIGSEESGQIGQHHYGRDAALAGAGAATAGTAFEAERASRDQVGAESTSSGVTPHKSSILNKIDPRVKEDKPTASTDTKPTDTKDSHIGRDAALAGGAGVAGAGVYEAEKHHKGESGAGNGVVSGERGVIGSERNPYSSNALDPRVDSPEHRHSAGIGSQGTPKEQHHYGRDTALAGGAGIAGAAVYEEHKHNKQEQDLKATDGYQDQRAIPHQQTNQVANEPTQASRDHHPGRDAAAVGAVGAASLGADHEFSKKEAERHEKEAAKAEKKHEKEVDKAERKHEKEVEKDHKPSLISRILHRNKDKSEDDESLEKESKHHKEEAVGASAAGTGAAAHEHNKLHKDPPKGYYSPSDSTTTGGQHMGTDGQIGDVNSTSGLK
jgi:hypothetical protein